MAIRFDKIAEDTALNKENIDAFSKELSSFDKKTEEEKKYFYAKGIYFAAHLPLPEEKGKAMEGVELLNYVLHQTGSRQAAMSLVGALAGMGILEVSGVGENGNPSPGSQSIQVSVGAEQLEAVNDARRKVIFINPVSPEDALKGE